MTEAGTYFLLIKFCFKELKGFNLFKIIHALWERWDFVKKQFQRFSQRLMRKPMLENHSMDWRRESSARVEGIVPQGTLVRLTTTSQELPGEGQGVPYCAWSQEEGQEDQDLPAVGPQPHAICPQLPRAYVRRHAPMTLVSVMQLCYGQGSKEFLWITVLMALGYPWVLNVKETCKVTKYLDGWSFRSMWRYHFYLWKDSYKVFFQCLKQRAWNRSSFTFFSPCLFNLTLQYLIPLGWLISQGLLRTRP